MENETVLTEKEIIEKEYICKLHSHETCEYKEKYSYKSRDCKLDTSHRFVKKECPYRLETVMLS
jgi:hypothetical protein